LENVKAKTMATGGECLWRPTTVERGILLGLVIRSLVMLSNESSPNGRKCIDELPASLSYIRIPQADHCSCRVILRRYHE
jgi:hypothetical protein